MPGIRSVWRLGLCWRVWARAFSEALRDSRGNDGHLLGGSWVVISRVKSRVTILVTHIRGLITPRKTTHEPPSSFGGPPILCGLPLASRVPLSPGACHNVDDDYDEEDEGQDEK